MGYITLQEAASKLNCCYVTVRRLVNNGEITAKKVPFNKGPHKEKMLVDEESIKKLKGRIEHKHTAITSLLTMSEFMKMLRYKSRCFFKKSVVDRYNIPHYKITELNKAHLMFKVEDVESFMSALKQLPDNKLWKRARLLQNREESQFSTMLEQVLRKCAMLDTRDHNIERNAKILLKWHRGYSIVEIGKEYRISRERVNQILEQTLDRMLDALNREYVQKMLWKKQKIANVQSAVRQAIQDNKDEETAVKEVVPDIPLSNFALSVRTAHVIKNYRIATLKDLANLSERYVWSMRNAGRKTVSELKALLNDNNLSFAPFIK